MDRKTWLLVALALAVLVAGIASYVAWPEDPEEDRIEPGFLVRIHRFEEPRDRPALNETDMRERVPLFARALDQMIEEDDTYEPYRRNETIKGWLRYLDHRRGDRDAEFNYRNHTFHLTVDAVDGSPMPVPTGSLSERSPSETSSRFCIDAEYDGINP